MRLAEQRAGTAREGFSQHPRTIIKTLGDPHRSWRATISGVQLGLDVGAFDPIEIYNPVGVGSARRTAGGYPFERLLTAATANPAILERALHSEVSCWFKQTAVHLVASLAGYTALLDRYTVACVRIRSENPGVVPIEDDDQVGVTPVPVNT